MNISIILFSQYFCTYERNALRFMATLQFNKHFCPPSVVQGQVVQSIVSLTSSLRGQLVKCFTTLKPNTLIFLLKKLEMLLYCKSFSHFFNKKKMRDAFALQKLLTFFQQKILVYIRY